MASRRRFILKLNLFNPIIEDKNFNKSSNWITLYNAYISAGGPFRYAPYYTPLSLKPDGIPSKGRDHTRRAINALDNLPIVRSPRYSDTHWWYVDNRYLSAYFFIQKTIFIHKSIVCFYKRFATFMIICPTILTRIYHIYSLYVMIIFIQKKKLIDKETSLDFFDHFLYCLFCLSDL